MNSTKKLFFWCNKNGKICYYCIEGKNIIKGSVFMKKILFLVFALALIFSSCAEKEIEENEPVSKTSGYDMLGDTTSKKPSLGNYYIYTPIIDIFTPKEGKELSFLDFDGTKFITDSGTDKAFLLSYDLYDGKTENLTDKLGFHSSEVVSDGENYYFIGESENEPVLIHKNQNGELFSPQTKCL